MRRGRLGVGVDQPDGAAVDALGALFEDEAETVIGAGGSVTDHADLGQVAMPGLCARADGRGIRLLHRPQGQRGSRCRGSRYPLSRRGSSRSPRSAETRGKTGGGDQVERSTSTQVLGRTRARLAAMPPPVTWLSACTRRPAEGERRGPGAGRRASRGGWARAAPRPRCRRDRRGAPYWKPAWATMWRTSE